jgi:hypothetical protein
MAYDAAHDQLIATVGDPGGAILHGLDPVTLATRWTLPAPAVASRIVVSEDGSVAYLALPDLGTVWQVDLAHRVAVRSIVVGDRAQGEGPLSVAIRPGHPGTVAVAIGRVDLITQNFLRAAVWDDGVMRPKTTGFDGDYLVPDMLAELAFVDTDHVVGFDNQTTQCSLNRLTLLADGMQGGLSAAPLGLYAVCFGDQLAMTAGRLFTSAGAEFDPDTFAYLRAWPGVASDTGGGFFDTGSGTWVRINGGQFTDQDGVTAVRAGIEEVESDRYTLRRDAVTDPASRELAYVTTRMATSGSRIAFTVYDNFTGTIVVHALDLSTLAPLGHASFPVATASGTGVTGISLAMPGVAIATDPARHRLVVALDEGIGPDGNSLAVVDPDSGVVEKLILLGGRPTDLKVSTSGSIAYVSHIAAIPTIDRVDLVSGVVTSLPLRADSFAIKEDDPQSVAVLDYYVGYTLTLVHDMAVQGSPIDLRAIAGSQFDWIASNGPNQLIAVTADTIPTDIARFSWTANGLTYSGTDPLTSVAIGGATKLKSAFGSIWDSLGATDLDTQSRATFPGVSVVEAVAPTSSKSAVLGVADAASGPTLSWVQAAPTGSTWTSTFNMPLSDSGLPTNVGHDMRDAAEFDSSQVAVQFTWMGESRIAEPARIYIVKRVP